MDTTKLKGRLEGKVQELQKPVEGAALSLPRSSYIALTNISVTDAEKRILLSPRKSDTPNR